MVGERGCDAERSKDEEEEEEEETEEEEEQGRGAEERPPNVLDRKEGTRYKCLIRREINHQ